MPTFEENGRTARSAQPRPTARPLFASSATALAVALLAAAPQIASAANECGPDGAGQDALTCSDPSYPTGITYANSNGLTLNLNQAGMVVTGSVSLSTLVGPIAPRLTVNVNNVDSITSAGSAVSVATSAAGGLALVNVHTGALTTTGNVATVSANGGGAGADAEVTLTGGQVFNTGTGGGLLASTAGVAGTGNAAVAIIGGTVQTSGTAAASVISGPNHTGTSSVSMSGGSVLSSAANGLAATTAGKGLAQVQVTGGTVAATGANGDGIFASSKAGTFAVDVTGGTVTGGGLRGAAIHMSAAAGGTVSIGAGAVIDGSASGVSIRDGDANRDGVDEIGGNSIINTAGTLNGAVLLGGGTDTLNVTGGTINGNIAGDGVDTLAFNVGGGTFTHGAAFGITGMSAVVMNSGTVQLDGTIADASSVTVNGGTLVLGGTNSYTGGTFLNGGVLSVAKDANLGDAAGALDFDGGTLRTSADFSTARTVVLGAGGGTFQTDANLAVSSGITGAGSLTKTGAGVLTLSGTNTYGGSTNIAQGTLRAGAAGTFNAASAHNVATGATLDLAGFNQAVASLANSGTVSLVGAAAGTTLTVNGNYVGNNGVLKLGTALNAAGPSDRLVIDGGTATGRTSLQVTNLGGLGALTSGNGIEVITAQNGATTTAQTTKDAFSLAGGHVDAGAYEYRLYAADAAGAGENWFLRSTAIPVTPPATPGAPVVPVIAYRAEASLYAALPSQLRQGNLAMLADLRKRVGDDDVQGTATTPTGSDRRAWARVLSTDIDIQQGGTVSPTSKGRLTGFQAGTDLLATPNVRAGLYVGQLDGDATVNGFASGVNNLRTGRNDLRSQYVGVYGTFTADSGLYADVVVQSGRHRYTVEPMLGGGIGGKGNSLLGSIEVGQSFALGGSGWAIEPQLQLIHQHMDLSDSAILGAVVQPEADSGWIARAGVRVKGQIDTGIGALQPYGRFNVYRTSSGTDIARFVNGATRTGIEAPTGGTSTELAGGFTLALGQTTSLYGEIGKLWSSGGDARVKSSINGSLGVRVKW
ncbi:autotransporter family protein [Variovorax paradoxus]|uniref:autotransporter family protein n=1 Tax=Variovorax paradoxus TaxID=34073 RepID=UPI0005ABFE48|nr:autotransporter outer membrane beta-barrel domain-containing protein [Variovorax paradoxus]